jgi:fucose permease
MKSSFLLNLLIMFFIGTGIGTYEGVTDAMLLDIHTRREGLYININHFFVTFGSLMITLYLVFLQMNWRLSLTQSAVVVVALALFFVFVKIEGRAKKVDPLSTRVRFLIQQPVVGLLFVATICTVGLEMGSVGIMTTYLMELRGFDQVTSKLGLIIFLAGIAVGRVLVGVFTKKDWIFTNILLLFGFSTLFMTLLYYIDWGAASYVVIFITGLTVSSLLPLIITFAGLKYSEMTGTVLGIIKIGIAIGGILIPFILSIVSKYGSLRVSLAIYPLSGAVSFCLLYFNRKKFADHGSR